MATAVQVQAPPASVTARKIHHLRQFDGADRWVVLAMVGIPAFLHIGLVWFPTIASILLSFTNWNGVRLDPSTGVESDPVPVGE